MSADRPLAETIAEGRRLIAEATKGPWHYGPSRNCPGCFYIGQPAHCVTLAHVHNFPDSQREANARIIVLAVNALPALLDVAEAAAAYQEEMAALGNGVDPALSAALSALGLVTDGEGKEKSNG